MATQTDIPDLSDDEKAIIFAVLETHLIRVVLFALLQGIYTGICVVTLWNIFANKSGGSRRAMIAVILVLYIMTAISFAFDWSLVHYSFIGHGDNFWTVTLAFTGLDSTDASVISAIVLGIAGCISSIVADSTMVWRCWIVWGRRWIFALLPLIFMISGTAFKILQILVNIQATLVISFETCTELYTSFILATTLLCTLLIIYRILSIEWAKPRTNARRFSLGVYRNLIEVIVESAVIYSVTLILFMITLYCSYASGTFTYFDCIGTIARLKHRSDHLGSCSYALGWTRCVWTCPSKRFVAGKNGVVPPFRRESTHDDGMLSGTFSGNVEAQSEIVDEEACSIEGRHDI
ncbi:hypothetical protein IW261DRAFT_1568453 [Armillaria novae-zelandiae]|uniref:Uncharacterized protein n=1 Tax=Armillaria novae-zelandiae TaxID=153914 RepID=A0AA39P0J9_9AGAR|nr:hypothetical protein IW261DRAFT_1568453 [Armillaria novae-zelandiae]